MSNITEDKVAELERSINGEGNFSVDSVDDTALALIAFWRANQPTEFEKGGADNKPTVIDEFDAEGYPLSKVPCRHCGITREHHGADDDQCPADNAWLETRYEP